MTTGKYDDCFLKPEITKAGEFQVFKMKGKDRRGYDFAVRLAAISDETYPGDLPEKENSDRIEMYLGGKPAEIEKISGEVEVNLGKEKDSYRINKAEMVYIPKDVPVQHRIIKKPEDITWLLSFKLTPKQEKTEEQKGGK